MVNQHFSFVHRRTSQYVDRSLAKFDPFWWLHFLERRESKKEGERGREKERQKGGRKELIYIDKNFSLCANISTNRVTSSLKQCFDSWPCFIPSPSLWCVASVHFYFGSHSFPLKLLFSALKIINLMWPSVLVCFGFYSFSQEDLTELIAAPHL